MDRSPTLARSLSAVALVLGLLAPRSLRASDGAWTEIPPPGRTRHSAIYDSARQRLVIAGGKFSDNPAGVWILPLDASMTWAFVPTSGRDFVPNPGGAGHSGWSIEGCPGVYDPLRDRMLIEGADVSGPTYEAVYVLSFPSMAWTKLATAGTPPPGRFGHSAIYDPVGDRMITYGGLTDPFGPPTTDVWVLSLSGTPTWSQAQPSGSAPIGRYDHGAIYDPARARMVIFGGQPDYNTYGNSDLNDVWALSLSGNMSWTQLLPSGTPPNGTAGIGMIYDPVRDRMLAFGGGSNFPPSMAGQTWSLDFGTVQWQMLLSSGATGGPSFYDPVADRVINYGGSSTRELRLSQTLSWRRVGPLGNLGPGPYYDPALCFDGARSRALECYGGAYDTDYAPAAFDNLVRAFGLADSITWRVVDGSVPNASRPHARIDHSAIVDPARDNMIVFGGYADFGALYNDLWSLKLASPVAWTHLTSTGTPPSARGGHATIYDPGGDRMLLFGGADNSASMNDLWSLALGAPQWLPLTPSGTPPSPRQNATAVYDPTGSRVLLFGGFPGPLDALSRFGPAYNDLWALDLTGGPAWTQLSPTGTPPPPTHDPIAVFDPDRNRVEVLTDVGVWALGLGDPPSWQHLDIENTVFGGIERGAATYDPLNHRTLLLPYASTAMWELKVTDPVAAVPIPRDGNPPGLALRGAVPNPLAGRVTIGFALPGDGPARLSLYDVAGREVAAREVGTLGAGPHTVDLAPGGTLAAGVYLVRLSAGGRVLTARVAILR